MKRLLYLTCVSVVAVLLAAPAASAEVVQLNCFDSTTQKETIAAFEQDPSNPNGLSDYIARLNKQGITCEAPAGSASQQEVSSTQQPPPLPESGGTNLSLIIGGALLSGGGLLARKILRY
jgi:hypothetical protein